MKLAPHRRPSLLAPLAYALLALISGMGRTLAAPQMDPATAEIASVVQTFVEAFNAHDTVAMSILWSDQCIHHSALSGKDYKGRQAVVDAYAAIFKKDPGVLSLHVESLRFDSNNKATLVCIATLTKGKDVAARMRFAAKLVRYGQSWLFDEVEEAQLTPAAEKGLGTLDWLTGTWASEAPGGREFSQFQWAAGNAFLVRTYWKEGSARLKNDSPSNQGVQYFGWDAGRKVVQTWLFDSLGAYGEGTWQADGQLRWINTIDLRLPDGRRGSLTQVIAKLSTNQISYQIVDFQIGGVARPDTPPTTMVRLPANSVRPPSNTAAAR